MIKNCFSGLASEYKFTARERDRIQSFSFVGVIIVLGVLVFLQIPVGKLYANSESVSVSNTKFSQGDFGWIRVSGANDCIVSARVDNTSIPFSRDGRIRIGWFGIDFETTPGRKKLKITYENCSDTSSKTVPIDVVKSQFETQRLQMQDDEKVVLDSQKLRRVRRESRRIDRVLETVSSTRLWSLPFHSPVENYESGNSFGSRRIINGHPRSPHSGEDYSAEKGDPVYAINRGKVSMTGEFFFSGKSVFIDHGRGLHSMYFHLSEIDVDDGDKINKGQLIGEAGMSGRATGPHLHLGVQILGRTVDPDQFFTREFAYPEYDT